MNELKYKSWLILVEKVYALEVLFDECCNFIDTDAFRNNATDLERVDFLNDIELIKKEHREMVSGLIGFDRTYNEETIKFEDFEFRKL